MNVALQMVFSCLTMHRCTQLCNVLPAD